MLSPEQANAALLELQQHVIVLQQGAAINAQNMANSANTAAGYAQTLATMQGAIAANAATLANVQAMVGDGGRERGDRGNNDARINHNAAKGLAPREWSGEKDPVSFAEFSEEFVNYACALNSGAKHLLDQAARMQGSIDITVDLMEQPLIDGLAEAMDGEIYRQLFKVTKGESRIIVQNAGQGNGMQAWLNLSNAYAPRSATDASVAMKRVMYPTRGKSEATMPQELQHWLANLLAFEVRFHRMDDTAKRCGLQMLIPEAMWASRMIGQQYDSFDALLKHVKDIVGDRTLAAMRGHTSGRQYQGAQPMDIGQMADGQSGDWPDASDVDINAFQPKGKGKGAWGLGKGSWGQQPAWDHQPQQKGGKDGKGKGKKGKDGGKSKGKGKDVQCWTCGGWGHRSNQCPSEQKGGGKGVNEVGEGPPAPDAPFVPDDQDDEEEPAWLGMVGDASPQSMKKHCRSTVSEVAPDVQRQRQHCRSTVSEVAKSVGQSQKPHCRSTVSEVARSWMPTVTTGIELTMKGWEKYGPLLTPSSSWTPRSRAPRARPRASGYQGYFSILEDADDEDYENIEDEIYVIAEAAESCYTKVSAIIDSGAVEHVLPPNCLPRLRMTESVGSKAGKRYLSATGEAIPNMGQKILYGKTREGQPRNITFQVAPVRKPLISVARMGDAGNDVHLTDKPHIRNRLTGQVTALRREGKTFILDLWIRHPTSAAAAADAAAATKSATAAAEQRGFSRRV